MISGICTICGRVTILYTCVLCGARTCWEHHDLAKGVCTSCQMGKRA